MVVNKDQILKTDLKAFKGRQSFVGGLELPLSESVGIPDEEYEALSSSLRSLKGHVVSNLMAYLDRSFCCEASLGNGAFLQARVRNGSVELAIRDAKTGATTQRISAKQARALVRNEPHLLYKLSVSAQRSLSVAFAQQEEEEEKYPCK